MFAFLARVVVFLIAVSVIRSVVDYIRRLWQGTPQYRSFSDGASGKRAQPRSPAEGAATETTLRPDPVCGTYVAADTSLKKIIAGRVYHFCSTECRNKFSA